MTVRTAPHVQRVEALEAEELRLLACAVGEHLPIELALRVQRLDAERAELVGVPSPTCWPPAGELV